MRVCACAFGRVHERAWALARASALRSARVGARVSVRACERVRIHAYVHAAVEGRQVLSGKGIGRFFEGVRSLSAILTKRARSPAHLAYHCSCRGTPPGPHACAFRNALRHGRSPNTRHMIMS
eukprot:6195042-Pleurochrysis_carterae.AAC.2